jgi:acetyl esterase/lipase
MSAQRDRIDPASREPLEQLLQAVPGGFNAIPDIVERRAFVRQLLQAMTADLPPNDRVLSEDRTIPGPAGAPDVRVRVYTPVEVPDRETSAAPPGRTGVLMPGILYIHGGGMIIGDLDGEHLRAEMLCELTRSIVVSTDYRKAPEDAHPAQVEDCYAALTWMAAHASELDIDATRIAVYGGSAGGNLAIATTMMARDQAGPSIAFLMAPYPMLDDRNEHSSTHEITEIGIWDRSGNIEAWEWFLAGKPADAYAAPARATDLSGLPPTFIDVGELDLFRDEDIDFVQRLIQAGVPTEFHLYPGAYHASEVFAPEAELSQRIWAARISALTRALHG